VGREAILHSALESLPAHAISAKNKHLLLSFDTNPRFHGGCFGVWGTPPPKPLNCKIRFALPGDAIDRSWAHHVGDDSMLVLAKCSLSPEDITWMSCYSCSQSANLSLTAIHPVSSTGKTKNPAYVSVSRVREIFLFFVTCLHPVYPKYLRAVARQEPWIVQG